ncbi:MAG: DNA primase [Deltaproteobacteria bacterium]|nr:DNA primase [Deltaproteobacteria bacterium]
MTQAFRDDAVETIRQRVDIVELVSRYVKLKKAGRNYVGLCPFHAEKTGSFSVNHQKGFFHCFGCKASGDVFSFLMKIEGKSFPEVLDELAASCGVELPKRNPKSAKVREQKTRFLELNETTADFFEDQLWKQDSKESARQYMQDRQTTEEIARQFRVGYAQNQWQGLVDYLKAANLSLDDASSLGLVASGSRGLYDALRDRIVFPIIGLDGKVRGFGARKLDSRTEGPKYINSRQSQVYDKSEVLYGLQQARPEIQHKSEVILVEGYFDVLSLAAAGIKNSVATCGTALTQKHASILRRFAQKIIMIFDSDAAGIAASFRSAQILLAEDLSPYMVLLPQGEDPDSFVRDRGGSEFAELVATAKPTIEVLAKKCRDEAGQDVEARTDALKKLVPVITACTDSLRLGNYIRWVADFFSVNESDLRNAVSKQRKVSGSSRSGGDVFRPAGQDEPAAVKAVPEEETLTVLLLRYPALIRKLSDRSIVSSFSSAPLRELVTRIIEIEGAGSPAPLLAGIEDGELRGRLSGLLMDDGAFPEDRSAIELDRCVLGVRRRHIRTELRLLIERIGQAEKAGKEEEKAQLLRSKMRLDQELVSLVGATGSLS